MIFVVPYGNVYGIWVEIIEQIAGQGLSSADTSTLNPTHMGEFDLLCGNDTIRFYVVNNAVRSQAGLKVGKKLLGDCGRKTLQNRVISVTNFTATRVDFLDIPIDVFRSSGIFKHNDVFSGHGGER